jgi:hypothetical protein
MSLTKEQESSLERGEPVRVLISGTACILIREDAFRDALDDSLPTMSELDLLACQTADMIEDSLDEPL